MRSVYYDPFGMRTEGYRAGVSDEMQLQDQTRRARMSDWDFANVKPLELQGLQREEQFQQFYDPLRRQGAETANSMGLGTLYDAQLGRAGQFGLMTGQYYPARQIMHDYFRPARTYQEYDPQTNAPIGDPRYYYDNGTGGLVGSQYGDQSLQDYFGWERSMQLAEQERAAAALGLTRDQLLEQRYQFDRTLPIQQMNADTQRGYFLRNAAGQGIIDGFGQ